MTLSTLVIEQLIQKKNLDYQTCKTIFEEMLATKDNLAKFSAFLVLLRAKKETAEEFTAIVTAMKERMIKVTTQHAVLDIVGTGGDHANTVNISTGSAILAASCGIKIAKHGNRAVSSSAGSADVLEALGININLSAEKITACIEEIGIGFCFAPNFHPAMQEVRMLRKQLTIPTIFNMLGPLLNPTDPQYILLGVHAESQMQLAAHALQHMKIARALIIHGQGLDELNCIAPNKILAVTPTTITESSIDPKKLGLPYCTLADLQGGDAKTNANLLLDVFSGKQNALANTLILNAATALYLYGRSPSIEAAIPYVKENLSNGNTLTLLKKWQAFK